ncbi:SUMF1/EgtB/PvdO family nonheme iron enzyme [Oceaniglobus roseus]|uniref:SUMF1/EgtB/PvdO family nonheme iron enzyme n=1 Tax=Oceaniglobus roseus TaxID=1737570 RepID=UPI000C7EAA4E|nr:SUMF1/EgtB/PvdO family nonheme iron enzyme [Kandeliimicrobium roseum]
MDETDRTGCCAPARNGGGAPPPLPQRGRAELATVAIPAAARPVLGTAVPRIADDGEGLRRAAALRAFRITPGAITNADFAAFVAESGYVTEAERFGWSFVFWSDVPEHIPVSQGVAGIEWWRRIDGATWRDINGPGTAETAWHPDHPVVQVSWNDAAAFAAWAGGRLPGETEWEHAARGGLGDVPYPWGTAEPDDTATLPCNIWQGRFPQVNTAADGYRATAPALSFAPNGYGLFNCVGNVWEWTADAYRIRSLKTAVKARLRAMAGYRVAKGGSFLCHRSYCWRYRIAARSGNSPDSATPHMGFRVVFDV